MIKRALIIVALVAIAVLAGLWVRLGGMRLVGFRYAVSVDNRATDFPNIVTQVDGRRITLDDGRVLLVNVQVPEYVAQVVRDENRVSVVNGVLYTPKRIGYWGFAKPENSQFITVPVFRSHLRRYRAEEVGDVRPAAELAREGH